MLSEIVSWISLPDSSLLIYRNAILYVNFVSSNFTKLIDEL